MIPAIQTKHESCDLSGSVYLIASDGRILDLPIPSASHHDPLNWSLKRRALASLAIGFFSFVGLVLVLGPNLAANGLREEFSFKVMLPPLHYSQQALIFLLGKQALRHRHFKLSTFIFHGCRGFHLDSTVVSCGPKAGLRLLRHTDVLGNSRCRIREDVLRASSCCLHHRSSRRVFPQHGTRRV
jgi:hypothetical protein